MIISLRVDVDGMYFTGGAIVEVPELMRREFEPVGVSDCPISAKASGDMLSNSRELESVIKLRKDAAKILAEKLTWMIIDEMRKNDTFNGY